MSKNKLILIVFFTILIFNRNNLYSQYFINENSVKYQSSTCATIVGEAGVILQTATNGLNWNLQTSNTSNTLNGLTAIDFKRAIIVGNGGIILKTIDGGSSWIPKESQVSDNLNDISTVPESQSVVACGNNNVILYSADLGETWVQVPGGTTNNYNLKHIYFLNHNIGFIIGSNSTLYKTTDKGLSWASVNIGFGTFQFNSIAATDINHLTVVGDNGTVFCSGDCGYSWVRPPIPVYTQNMNQVIFTSPNDGIILGDNGLILKCSDGGSMWSEATIIIVNPYSAGKNLMSVSFFTATQGIAVGSSGVILYTTDGGNNWSDQTPARYISNTVATASGSHITLNQNYPNPFNPCTVINYSVPFNSFVSLKIYDMLGKEIKTIVNSNQSAGDYSFRFDGSNLSSGIYFYVLKASGGKENFSKTMRMILTK